MLGRIYLDLGDRLAGRKQPPEPVTVLNRSGQLDGIVVDQEPTLSDLSGEPGYERGWMMLPTFDLRMCPRHAAAWRDGSHIPAWVGERRDGAACSCGAPLVGRTLGGYADAYRAHLEEVSGQ